MRIANRDPGLSCVMKVFNWLLLADALLVATQDATAAGGACALSIHSVGHREGPGSPHVLPTQDMVADVFTKALPSQALCCFTAWSE
jgi:hypothetical protein